MIANDVLSNPKLSWQAKGLYAYLYSKPENWNFSVFRIIKETTNKRDATIAAIQELEDIRLLKRIKQQSGHTTYWVTYPPDNFPVTENPEQAINKPVTENPHVRKIRTISKKEGVSSKLSKKDIAPDKSDALPFFLEEKLDDMEKVPGMFLDIIATFIREKKLKPQSSKELSSIIKRHCRAAKELEAFVVKGPKPLKRIFAAMDRCEKESMEKGVRKYDWTLETVWKSLTK